jgi:hypothetical protein
MGVHKPTEDVAADWPATMAVIAPLLDSAAQCESEADLRRFFSDCCSVQAAVWGPPGRRSPGLCSTVT